MNVIQEFIDEDRDFRDSLRRIRREEIKQLEDWLNEEGLYQDVWINLEQNKSNNEEVSVTTALISNARYEAPSQIKIHINKLPLTEEEQYESRPEKEDAKRGNLCCFQMSDYILSCKDQRSRG